MANYSRWEDVKKNRGEPTAEVRTGIEQDLALGQLIYDLRTEAGLSQNALAKRMGTTQSVISRLEEGGGARNRLDTLASCRHRSRPPPRRVVSREGPYPPEGRRAGRMTLGRSASSRYRTSRPPPGEGSERNHLHRRRCLTPS